MDHLKKLLEEYTPLLPLCLSMEDLGGLGHLGVYLRSRIIQLVDIMIPLVLPFELLLLPVLKLLLGGGFGVLIDDGVDDLLGLPEAVVIQGDDQLVT